MREYLLKLFFLTVVALMAAACKETAERQAETDGALSDYEESTFRRHFKKYYGVTPAAYRDLHADKEKS